VAKLSHPKAARELQGVELRQDGLVVLGGAQLGHSASAEGEVDTRLDGHGVVRVRQRLKERQEPTWVCDNAMNNRQHGVL